MQRKYRTYCQRRKIFKKSLGPAQVKDTFDAEVKLYESIRRYLVLLEIFVCLPIGLHRLHNETFLGTNIRDRLLKAILFIWSVFMLVGIVFCSNSVYKAQNKMLRSVERPLYLCEYWFYLIHPFHIFYTTHLKCSKFKKFLHDIALFDRRTSVYDSHDDYRLLSRFYHLHSLLILAHVLSVVIIELMNNYSSDVGALWSSFVLYMLPNTVLEMSLVFYYWLLYAVTRRLLKLNRVLKRLLLNYAYEDHEVLFLQRRIQHLRLLYGQLELLTSQINEIYSTTIILVYVGSCVNISLNIYIVYKFVSDSTLAESLYPIAWTIMHAAKMFLIMYYNDVLQDQKQHALLLLNDFKGPNHQVEETVRK